MKSIHLMKNVGRFTPPQNRQVRFTLKSPSLIYPQIICTIYPPSNHQVRFGHMGLFI